MPKTRLFFKYWLPVILWMMLIFSASGDTKSFQRSSRIIGPLINWLFPNLSEENVDQVVTAARKGAHLTEYAILAILFWRAIRQPKKSDPRPWNRKLALGSVLFVALYAMTDEYHQSLIPERQGSVLDVLIDTAGAGLGMLFLWLLIRWRKSSGNSKKSAERRSAL
ncbi:MAG: VanZ family protein [Akkermansiaceae bacterium]|nr:VanZ family protein [Verrucomicrobiales bacterium]